MLKQKFFLAIFFMGTFFATNAQIDVTANPLTLIFSGRADVGADVGITNDFSAEGMLSYLTPTGVPIDGFDYDGKGIGISAIGKYYLNPKNGADRFHLGGYAQYKNVQYGAPEDEQDAADVERNALALGFYLGYKVVSSKNIVFDIGLGFGRKLQNEFTTSTGRSVDLSNFPLLNLDSFSKIAIGYRF